MVDTLIITSALRCKPPRRDETVVLLSGPNRYASIEYRPFMTESFLSRPRRGPKGVKLGESTFR